ncbi:MAG: tungsten cofactor oxidoreductase radical SAM maturase [Thermosphaera sp.]
MSAKPGAEETSYVFPAYDGEFVVRPRLDLRILFIEPTTRCNLRCEMCFKQHWTDREGDMEWDLFEKVLGEAAKFPRLEAIVFGGIGEPTVHPRISEMIGRASGMGFKTYVTTNRLFLNSSEMLELVEMGLTGIYFSVDYMPFLETHLQHASSSVVLERIKNIAEWRAEHRSEKPFLGVQVVVTKHNYKYLPDLVKLLKNHGVDEVLVSNLIPVHHSARDMIVYDGSVNMEPVVEELERLASRGVRLRLSLFSLKTERRCFFDEARSTVVRWDGEVSPCYRFLHSYKEYVFGREKQINHYSFGNVKDKGLDEIWMSREYTRFRFITRNYYYPSCTDCWLRDSCDFVRSSDVDCWANQPSCGDCLWARNLIQCPIPI